MLFVPSQCSATHLCARFHSPPLDCLCSEDDCEPLCDEWVEIYVLDNIVEQVEMLEIDRYYDWEGHQRAVAAGCPH